MQAILKSRVFSFLIVPFIMIVIQMLSTSTAIYLVNSLSDVMIRRCFNIMSSFDTVADVTIR